MAGKNSLLLFKIDQCAIKIMENLSHKLLVGRDLLAHCWMQPPFEKFIVVYFSSQQLLVVSQSGDTKYELGMMTANLKHYVIKDILMFEGVLLIASQNSHFSVWTVEETDT